MPLLKGVFMIFAKKNACGFVHIFSRFNAYLYAAYAVFDTFLRRGCFAKYIDFYDILSYFNVCVFRAMGATPNDGFRRNSSIEFCQLHRRAYINALNEAEISDEAISWHTAERKSVFVLTPVIARSTAPTPRPCEARMCRGNLRRQAETLVIARHERAVAISAVRRKRSSLRGTNVPWQSPPSGGNASKYPEPVFRGKPQACREITTSLRSS